MQKPKVSKTKQKQASMLSTVMAEFDIETLVNKMVLRAFDSLMRSNKQAFDFINQSEHKFVKCEQRLAKAQTYYQNIELNINSKIELTDNMNARLQEFSGEFWQAMKEHNNEMIGLSKKFDQLSMEKKTLENRVNDCEKHGKKMDTLHLNLNDKVNEEVQRLYSTIGETDTRVGVKFEQQKQQLQQLSTNIIQSRSLLESKSSLLTQLMKDLEVYKNDRPQIMDQIKKLFEEIGQRAFKLELVEMRGYVDSKIVEEGERVNGLCVRLDTQVKVEERERKKEDGRLGEILKGDKAEHELKLMEVKSELSQRLQSLSQQLKQSNQSASKTFQQLSLQLSTLKSNYQKQIPQITSNLSQMATTIDALTRDTRAVSNQVKEAFSNIQSINQLIETIISDNKQRKEEMKTLKSTSSNQGNVEQQVHVIFQKITLIDQTLYKIQSQTINNLATNLQTNHQHAASQHASLSESLHSLQHQFQTTSSHQSQSLTTLEQSLKHLIQSTTDSLQTQLQTVQTNSRFIVEQKIFAIQKQLNQLDQIQQEIKHFKQVFKTQIEENDKVNVSVGEKMQRVMAMFTKLKSDLSIKFEQLNGDLQRKSVEIKTSLNDIDSIKKYLSISSECINILIATSIFTSGNSNSAKDPTLTSNQSLNSTINADNKMQHPQSKQIKITSILQGWVLQADETQQKIKYRGEIFSAQSRVKLMQLLLDFYVKQTQKIKGQILENGKDVFMKIMESGEEMFQQRKRAMSKKKPSQLPKLYM